MTEEEWLACTDPEEMRIHLRYNVALTERKLRLLAVASCRLNWHNLVDFRSKAAVQIVEQFVDGRATEDELDEAANQAIEVIPPERRQMTVVRLEGLGAAERTEWFAAQAVCSVTAFHGGWEVHDRLQDVLRFSLDAAECQLVGPSKQTLGLLLAEITREIVGNPFHPATLNPAWQTPTVVALAQAASDNRILPAGTLEPARLAVLADALEEAGCDNSDILNHLRQPGEHVRGCWPIDLLLGRG
jgi:hypothetical protein